ncbi:hypothetical protein PGT21_031318 [Puccinia graminis f. sp. tritici]|uniref:Uncharacterized protein n=1 Tax=Puccinia graminis f. sp. tritici TaxID=56615 RepID=A0A5B0S023_PUCGR|nr:hypothetical protein PGT21_031318 [Puccinia graminis f. sp. tritici]KAA1131370.1 hypothetical protein PGTUg99_032953 [Puccinia graminis f. sp. tritici]
MSRAVDAKIEAAAPLNLTLIMILITTLTRRLSYQLYIAAWLFTLALKSCELFDLNKLPTEYFDEAFPSVSAEISRGKFKEHPVQHSTLSPPTRRARLSHDQVGSSDSGSIHEFDWESNPSLQVGQSSGGGSKSVPHLDNDLSDTDLPGIPAVEEKDWDELDFSHFITRGIVIEELLHTFSERFKSQVMSQDCRSRHWGLVDPHPTVSTARIDVAVEDPYKLAKVLHYDLASTQTAKHLYMLYKFLVVSLFKLHGEYLTQINIPVLHHRNQQEKLLEWLDKQIFSPGDSHPVLGIAPESDLTWESGGPSLQYYGDIQKELILYFSDDKRSDPNICASAILKPYRTEHAKYLSNMAKKLEINLLNSDDRHSKQALEHSALVTPYVSTFEKRFRTSEIEKGDVRSYYPTLQITMCFHDHKPGPKPLRMIDPAGKIYKFNDLRSRLRKLMKALDCLTIGAMSELKIRLSDKDIKIRRKSVLKFLVDSMIQPKGSLPLIGSVESPEGIAPWFSNSHGNPVLFGEIQLKIMKYLTDYLEEEDLIQIPAFVLSAWHYANPKYELKLH